MRDRVEEMIAQGLQAPPGPPPGAMNLTVHDITRLVEVGIWTPRQAFDLMFKGSGPPREFRGKEDETR